MTGPYIRPLCQVTGPYIRPLGLMTGEGAASRGDDPCNTLGLSPYGKPQPSFVTSRTAPLSALVAIAA